MRSRTEVPVPLQPRICIDVPDLEKAVAFYRDALGLTPGRRLGRKWAEMLGAASPIDLLAEPAGTPPVPRPEVVRDYRRHWTPVHLDWPVPDLAAALQRGQAAGGALGGEVLAGKW